MKEIKKNYIGVFLVSAIIFCIAIAGYIIIIPNYQHTGQGETVETTDFGLYLATQHALYVNDFESASNMIDSVKSDKKIVNQTKKIANFFNGKIPDDARSLKDSKDLVDGMIYDAYLIQNDDWKSVYNRHNKDVSILAAPMRIFSAVTQDKYKETYKFIDSLQTTDSWKSFIRGQISVLRGNIDDAAKEFANVHPEFMNVNDYLYLMSFYKHNDMLQDMEILNQDFIAKVGSMYMIDYDDIPDWENYAGYKKNLVFSIIQTISHTQIMIYTDLSLTFLRFAEIISDAQNMDAINYYLGQYYYNNYGDFKTCFNKISQNSPLYLFGQLRIAESKNNTDKIQQIAQKNPLFVPALLIAVNENIRTGNRRAALGLLNRGLSQRKLPITGRVFFLKQRAYVNLMFNRAPAAQKDIIRIQKIAPEITPDIMLLQARIWEKQNKNLDNAYDYTMNLIKLNKSDVNAWDTLGLIIKKREGVKNALELLEQVSESGTSSSAVYEHLGDLYAGQGNKDKARRAYNHALDLSKDCMIVVPNIHKKLRKLK